MENQFVQPVIGDVLPGVVDQTGVINPDPDPKFSGAVIEKVGDGLYNTILPDGQVATVADDGTIVDVG